MNLNRLIKQLKIDEGVRLKVYKDSLGYATVGVGHLIKETDPDEIRNLKHGDTITEEQCSELFKNDLAQAVSDALIVFDEIWDDFPDIIQEVFVNMIFNLGRTRFLKFKKTILAAYAHDWDTVSTEMLDSLWAKQVGQRAYRMSAQVERWKNY